MYCTMSRDDSPSTVSQQRKLATSFVKVRVSSSATVTRSPDITSVKKHQLGRGGIPFIVTHDGRTIRYPDPDIKVNDTVKFDIKEGKITGHIKFDTGNLVVITGGRNMGRVGTITHRERHIGGFDIVHVKDVLDRTFATR